jgi:hypothetical protein
MLQLFALEVTKDVEANTTEKPTTRRKVLSVNGTV